MEYSRALAKQIDTRIVELKAAIDAHERALAALKALDTASTTTVATNGHDVAAKPARPASGRRSRVDGASAEVVFDAVEDGEDQAALIAKQFGVATAQVRSRLQELEQAGRVTHTGQRRGTRWHSAS
jgi:predicted Rossmann fold nucleotide-binding protein DprA/Smf involved in DNA uptake